MNDQTKSTSVPTPTQLVPPSVNEEQLVPQVAVNDNPLASYFRTPKIQLELPTKGKFWPEGTLELKTDGMLDVLSMTARDEIIMKSPEGLLSGSSVTETIQSCIPGIKNAHTMPSHDIDSCLIAIRIASYGHDLGITTTCPHCKEPNEHRIDLRVLLDSIPKGTIQHIHNIGDLTFEFMPYDWAFVNENNRRTYEGEKQMRSLVDAEMGDEEKRNILKSMFNKLTIESISSISLAIQKINANGQGVTNKNQITEFVNKADRDLIELIRKKITLMNDAVTYPPIELKCENAKCLKTYPKTVEFNQTTFFE